MSDEAEPSPRESAGHLVRESGKLSALTMASRILGLIRERTRGALMGTGVLADAFTVAFSVPNLFRRLFAEGSMAAAFIPTVKASMREGNDQATEDFLSATFTVLSLSVGLVVALGIAASPLLVGMFDSEPVETTILMRTMFPFLALVSVAAFFQGILNAHGVFGPSGFAPILFNLSFILVPAVLAGFTTNPARAMAVAVVFGGFLQAVCQLPYVIRLGARFKFVNPVRALANPGMKRVLGLIGPTILGMAAYEVNGLVSTSLATRAGTGAATALTFSLRLQELVLGVFVVSVGTVLLPELSGSAAAADWVRYRDRLVHALETIALVTVPLAVFSIIERHEIVSVVYMTREFGQVSANLTAGAFLYHMIGLPFIGANRILAPAFYARSDSRTPAVAGIVAVGINIAVALALQPLMGGSGIALALSIASAVNMSVLVVMLLRLRIVGLRKALVSVTLYVVRLFLFSGVAAVPVLLIRNPLARQFGLAGSVLVGFGVPLTVAALVFGGIGVALLAISRDAPARALVSAFRRRGRR